ncbi:MAG: glucose 1-dehydrogenase [Peptococcaceae bacterium]|nr:glucose 1-dehydrogenase [Peptococcaceae bacterium]
MKLKDKVALVTGGSRGIGRAICLAFASEGAAVAVNATTFEGANKTAEEIRRRGGRSIAVKANVADPVDVSAMVERVVSEFDRLDILVNNAGISMAKPSAGIPLEDWRRAIDIDLNGVFYCSQTAGRQMLKQKSGNIINMSSMYGLVAAPARAAYSTSKGGINALTKVLAVEWAKDNIRVNAICPGYIMTELVTDLIGRGMLDEAKLAKRCPMGRLGNVEEVARVAVFLASDDSSYINGQAIVVDGGWSVYGYITE